MNVRYLVDEDVHGALVKAVRLREPSVDIIDVKQLEIRGSKDPEILEFADRDGRVLVTFDHRTMPRHFGERLSKGKTSAGVLIFSQKIALGEVVDSLLLIWSLSDADEWRNGLFYMPLG